MKKNNLFIIIATCLMLPGSLYAGTCTQYTPDKGDDDEEECEAVDADCVNTGVTRYYRNSTGDHCYIVQDCKSCPSPLSLVTQSVSDCTGVTYKACDCVCTASKPSDVGWKDLNTGYQEYIVYECSCDSSSAKWVPVTSEYRCNVGYYGNAEWGGTSGCTRCPTASGIYTTSARQFLATGTSAAGTTSVTGCYMPTGTYYDVSGTFTITGSCMY